MADDYFFIVHNRSGLATYLGKQLGNSFSMRESWTKLISFLSNYRGDFDSELSGLRPTEEEHTAFWDSYNTKEDEWSVVQEATFNKTWTTASGLMWSPPDYVDGKNDWHGIGIFRVEFLDVEPEIEDAVDTFFDLREQIFKHVGYKEDWRYLPIADNRDSFWAVDDAENSWLKHAPNRDALVYWLRRDDETYGGPHGKEVYQSEIYTNRHLPKWVYRGDKYTLVVVDTNTDGNQWLELLSNDNEVDIDVEQGRYTDPDGVVWRVMHAWDDGDCRLESKKPHERWKIACETGSLDERKKPEDAVKETVDWHKQSSLSAVEWINRRVKDAAVSAIPGLHIAGRQVTAEITVSDDDIVRARTIAINTQDMAMVTQCVIASVPVGAIVNGEPIDADRRSAARDKCAEYLKTKLSAV